MQLTWVNKNNSDKLIIFFNGWSLDENIVNHLTSDEFDVLIFYDYSDLEISQEAIKKINSYKEINVIAWSFGVWACGNVINNFNNLKNVIAINGTLIPIDNNLGIPEKIFNLTLTHLSEENYVRFFKNMFKDGEKGEADLNKLPKGNIENQKHELQQIQKMSAEKNCAENAKFFNKVFISTNDKIIPAKNQLNFWGENIEAQSKPQSPCVGGLGNPPYFGDSSQALVAPQIIKIESGHYIFDLFKTWDEIING